MAVSKTDRVAPHRTLSDYYGEDSRREAFVRQLFDETAPSYDRIERLIGFGTGPHYRRSALERAGLREGMRVLDVAVGTGLVAREALRLVGPHGAVIGLDPSVGMLHQARVQLGLPAVLGFGECQPLRAGSVDFLSMGYALRHLSDLTATFSEFHRVLVPGGRLCLLELTRPEGPRSRAVLRAYLHGVVPFFTRLFTRKRNAAVLMRYFWETIDACVPPDRILAALDEAGFVGVHRKLSLNLFSEYSACKPGSGLDPADMASPPPGGNFFVRVMSR